MKYFLLLTTIIIIGFFSSCSQESKEILISAKRGIVDTINTEQTNIYNFSIEQINHYEGVLPCDNCPGVETELTLYPNNKYERTSLYMETGDSEIIEKGHFTWIPSSSIIKLENTKINPAKFIIEENQIRVYDSGIQSKNNFILIKK